MEAMDPSGPMREDFMKLIDRVAVSLEGPTPSIGAAVFEECVTSLLAGTYPALAPVRGGTDWGSDADMVDDEGNRTWIAITSSRGYAEARKNLKTSMQSIREHGLDGDRIIAVNLASLERRKRDSLGRMAADAGFQLMQVSGPSAAPHFTNC